MIRYVMLGVVFLLATALTAGWTSLSRSYSLLDVPNTRSSHGAPTPRGAGVAIILAFIPVPLLLLYEQRLDPRFGVALCVGGALVGLIGLVDDYRSVAPRWRFLVQMAAAALVLVLIGPPPELLRHSPAGLWHGAVWLLALFAIVWHVNLFNFMDGIDGIAGAQAAFVAAAGGVLAYLQSGDASSNVYLSLAAACAGFLVWNWPPAKVFMGDVGSGFLGFVLATFALHSAATGALSVWTWFILMSAFIADATVTLVRRLLRGERVHEAHRSHAYQWSARRLRSHAAVTLGFVLVDVLWLLPLAWLSTLYPSHRVLIACSAALPLIAGACLLGAGRAEGSPSR